MATSLFSVLARRIQREECGFSLLEMVVAMGVIFISMTVLAATALVGFRGSQTARQRQTATALADKLVEQVRALPFAAVKEGLKDSDLSGDIVSCSGIYRYQSCSGDGPIVHQAVLTYTSTPLYPHRVTLGAVDGFSQGGTRSVYVTPVTGSTNVYRLTVVISWTAGNSTLNIQTQTQLSSPTGSGGSSTTTGTSTAYFYGLGSLSPGSVVVTPNAAVYSGVGVTGLSTSVWNTGGTDSVTQRLSSLNAEIMQGQLAVVDGQSTATSVEKSIAGTVTTSPLVPASTYSSADDDPTTSSIGTSSAPTATSQPGSGVSMSLSGSGNSLTLNQYTQTTTTTTTTGNVSKRSASYATSASGSVTVTAPTGMIAGDLLLAGLSYQGACMATPSGWTVVRCDTNTSGSNNVTSAIYYKFATAADVTAGSFAFTTGGTSGTVAGIIAYTGADPTTPIDTSGVATGTSTTATTPTMTVTSNARLVSFFAARGNTTVTPVDPGSSADNWTQNWSANGGGSQKGYLSCSSPPCGNGSTSALTATAGTGTLTSSSTTATTFSLAKSFSRTVDTNLANGANNWPFQVSVGSVSSSYQYCFRLVRQNSSSVEQSASGTSPLGLTSCPSGNSTAWSTGSATQSYTFNWNPGTWQTGDKLVVEWWQRKPAGGNPGATGTINTTSSSYVDAPPGDPLWVAGAAAGGDKHPPGQGVLTSGWTASLSQSALWVAQLVSLKPNSTTSTTTTTGTAGTETGSTVSATAASVSPACGSPSQTDGKPCAYAVQSIGVPSGVDNAFLSTTVDFTNSTNGYTGLGTCRLYKFSPPNTSPTNYAYGRRQATSGDGKVREDVKRYYGTHTFGQFCSGSNSTPSGWPGYFVKFDAGTAACEAIAEAGISAGVPATTTCGTISVWNGSGTTSFAPPASGTWSTSPTTVSYTSGSYKYDMTATLGSGQTSTTSTGSSPITVGKAVVGSPVVGTITYKLTDTTTSRVLIDVTLTIDLGTLTSSTTYTAAA
jgi:type II secretory pathway pseudopilin PulG